MSIGPLTQAGLVIVAGLVILLMIRSADAFDEEERPRQIDWSNEKPPEPGIYLTRHTVRSFEFVEVAHWTGKKWHDTRGKKLEFYFQDRAWKDVPTWWQQ